VRNAAGLVQKVADVKSYNCSAMSLSQASILEALRSRRSKVQPSRMQENSRRY